MKKKAIALMMIFSLVLTSFAITSIDTDATSGMLKQNTVRKCKGVWYGMHKNHWHRAKKSKKNKKWYASGKSLGKKKPKACR